MLGCTVPVVLLFIYAHIGFANKFEQLGQCLRLACHIDRKIYVLDRKACIPAKHCHCTDTQCCYCSDRSAMAYTPCTNAPQLWLTEISSHTMSFYSGISTTTVKRQCPLAVKAILGMTWRLSPCMQLELNLQPVVIMP